MSELWLPRQNNLDASDKVRVGKLAGGQIGRVTGAQMRYMGVSRQTVWYWADSGYLYPELPGVYAVGHPGRTEESDLFAAVLYAGPDAGLRALTAALWRGIVKWETAPAIEVSTPRRCRSLPADDPQNRLNRAIEVRERRPPERWPYHGIPTVPIPNIVLDLAATGNVDLVRFALANLDYMRALNIPALMKVTGRGIPGSAALTLALANQQPLFARVRSKFEFKLIQVCEQTDTPFPEVNEVIAGVRPDAVWYDQMVVVQCDGERNHNTWRQRRRDAKDDQILRGLGFLIIRYVYEQLDDPWAIHADLMPILTERAGRAAMRIA